METPVGEHIETHHTGLEQLGKPKMSAFVQHHEQRQTHEQLQGLNQYYTHIK